MPVIHTRDYCCFLASVMAASTPTVAEEADEAIARCARIAAVGDRILCLETALRQSSDTGVQDAKPAIAEVLEIEDEVLAATTERAPVGLTTGPVADSPAVVTDATPAAAASTVVTAVAGAPTDAVGTAASQQSELGAEQVSQRDGTRSNVAERTSAIITAHELVLTGRLRLTLDNGQVWQQTTDDDRNTARYLRGSDSVPVEMWRSRSGGYRMYLVPFDRTLRVRRLK